MEEMEDNQANSSPSPHNLESTSPRPRDLDSGKPRPRKLHPNFFLKQTLLTFEDFKERFGRVHSLDKCGGGRVDGFPARATSSACDTGSQRDDHTSVRSKSNCSISIRSSDSIKPFALSQYPNEHGLNDGVKQVTKDTRKKPSNAQDLVITCRRYRDHCEISATIDYSLSESAFKIQDGDFNGRFSKPSKSLTCKVGGETTRHKHCRGDRTSAGVDAKRADCIRTSDSVDSGTESSKTPKVSIFTRKCFNALKSRKMGHDLCENECRTRNTYGANDYFSGNLKKADSDTVQRCEKNCADICSETSIIRTCIRAKRSGTGNSVKNTLSGNVVCEECSGSSLDQSTLRSSADDDDLSNHILASKAKNYGFNYEDICDVSEPPDVSANSGDDDSDDIKHLNKGRYSNQILDSMKKMLIERKCKTKTTSEKFTLRRRFYFYILKSLEIILRFFPIPPLNITFEKETSPIDVFRNEKVNGSTQNKCLIDGNVPEKNDTIERMVTTDSIMLYKKDSLNSVSIDYSIGSFSFNSKSTIVSSDGNLTEEMDSSIKQPHSNVANPSSTTSEQECIRNLGNYVSSGHLAKRNKSEPSMGNLQKFGLSLKNSVGNLINVPSRFIPIKHYECIESNKWSNKMLVRLLAILMFIYACCLLGYPIVLMFWVDMLFGPDFTPIIYMMIGIVVGCLYVQYDRYRGRRNNHKLNEP